MSVPSSLTHKVDSLIAVHFDSFKFGVWRIGPGFAEQYNSSKHKFMQLLACADPRCFLASHLNYLHN